jgi:hypothetical protein
MGSCTDVLIATSKLGDNKQGPICFQITTSSKRKIRIPNGIEMP